MSAKQFNEIIHAPNRLQICALLTPLEEAEFQVLREALGVSDSVLSKHIKQLEDSGYLKVRKSVMNGRQRTWARLTRQGRQAFASHVAALREIVSISQGA